MSVVGANNGKHMLALMFSAVDLVVDQEAKAPPATA
jgi:hypothetical protein